ncbi:MAG: hypothetical protein ABI644_03800 [Arenimonas sp.]
MSAQSVKIESMFGWVIESLKLVKKNFRGFMSACIITIVLALLLCAPMSFVMMSTMGDMHAGGTMHAPGMPFAGDMTMFFIVYAITIVISMLMFPPILIGWFKLCQNIDNGAAVSGFEILKPYRDMQLWLRGIGFALLSFLIYIAILGLFALAFSGAISDFMHQIEAQQIAILSGTQPAPPSFPFGFMIGYFGFIFIAMFLQFVYMVGFTEISLRPTSALAAMKMAAEAVFKNALKLLLVLICVGIVFYIVFFIISIILVLIIGLVSLIHPVAGAIAAFALFLPLMLLLYPLIFSGHYFMWKSLLGSNAPALPNTYDSTLSV